MGQNDVLMPFLYNTKPYQIHQYEGINAQHIAQHIDHLELFGGRPRQIALPFQFVPLL